MFRRFFYKKPPEGLLEISERVFVFDCCFTTDVMEDNEYKVYVGGIVDNLREYCPDASYMVFNFREGDYQTQIASLLSEYDMTVMDYPRQYENCPLLKLEMIHHFLRSSESWLSLGQRNILLMHCERGGWPVLAFMLAALLIYRKQYTGEQKTLDMIYKQAPLELLQLMSPLNPLPSQLRYLQYVSRRNVGSEWPPLDRALMLDCVIIRVIPNVDGEGGCCPTFRIYGQDPLSTADRTSTLLFSTPKTSKTLRHYKQADCELVKIDIRCHIQGDVVLECTSLDNDLEHEVMMFRVMFNTAFIRSNILMLNREEIDTLWTAKDQFPVNFRTEVLFSEIDAASPFVTADLPAVIEEKGLPIEAFAKVREMFNSVDWSDPKADVALSMLHQINILQEKLDHDSPQGAKRLCVFLEPTAGEVMEKPIADVLQKLNLPSEKLETGSPEIAQKSSQLQEASPQRFVEKPNSEKSQQNLKSIPSVAPSKQLTPLLTPSPDLSSQVDNIEPQEQQSALQRPTHSKIITQRMPHTSLSTPTSSSGSSLQGSPSPISRYHNTSSALGITALLQDHEEENKEITHQVITSPSQAASESPARLSSPMSAGIVSILASSELSPSFKPSVKNSSIITKISSIPPPPPPPNLTKTSSVPPVSPAPLCVSPTKIPSLPPQTKTISEPPVAPAPVPPSPSPPPPSQLLASGQSSSLVLNSTLTSVQHKGQRSSVPPPPPPPPPASQSGKLSPPSVTTKLSSIPAPPRSPSFAGLTPSTTGNQMFPPPPPPPLPPSQSSGLPPSLSVNDSSSATTPAPLSGVTLSARVVTVGPPPPPPPPLCARTTSSPSVPSSAPPPPPPPCLAPKNPMSKNSPSVPSVPPPPTTFNNGVPKSSAAAQSHSGGNVPPIPGPPSMKGRPLSRQRNQDQSKRTSLKPYHWLKLTRAMQGSLWAETQKSDESSKAPEFDMAELESLFAVNVPNPNDGGTGGKSSRRSMGAKSDKITLIDLRRAYNCEIMLTKVKVPLPDLVSSVLDLDDSALDIDQVDNLIKFSPTKEEMELLKNYKGDKANLGKCEQFFLELMKVPRIESKLRVFSFKIQFHTQVSELRNSLMIVNSVSEEIRNSVKLKKIMQTILSLGNALNHGTARGSAVGFRLDSLLKLTDTRARNNKMTLMHYLCKVLSEKLPDLLDFSKDLVSLEASTKIQLKYLAEEMQAISKGLEKVVQELITSENDGPVSEHFRKILKEFLSFAEGEVRSLASLYSGVGRNADALAFYFGEDPARTPFEQVVSTLLNFVKLFVRAHDENCKQLELENRRAQKEAENEKLKISSSQKELDNDRMRMSDPVK